jgi:sulfur carrier protein ThiS
MTKTNKHGVVMPFIIRPLQLHELMMAEGPTINRMLTELEIECARQAVKNNGKIIHTYADFERSGTIRKAIKPGIRRLGQIGVLRKRSGRPGVGGYERPHYAGSHTCQPGRAENSFHRRMNGSKPEIP